MSDKRPLLAGRAGARHVATRTLPALANLRWPGRRLMSRLRHFASSNTETTFERNQDRDKVVSVRIASKPSKPRRAPARNHHELGFLSADEGPFVQVAPSTSAYERWRPASNFLEPALAANLFPPEPPRPKRYNTSHSRVDMSKRSNKQAHTTDLIRNLFSRHSKHRAESFRFLVKRPTFLAATFSTCLASTLIVLYAISLVNHMGQIDSSQQQQQQQQESEPREARLAVNTDSSVKNQRPHQWSEVRTECGTFQGEIEDDGLAFRGIPYASPPVGSRRWARPRPIWLDDELCPRNNNRSHSRSSHRPHRKSHCVQLSPYAGRVTGHEDCLYLEVFTARPSSAPRPVMVYLHGGFLAFGSSSHSCDHSIDCEVADLDDDNDDGLTGQVNLGPFGPSVSLARQLDVVLVAVNYRLQTLGFMIIEPDNGAGGQGNYGLWDQLVALNWIKRNIKSFGGDPGNVVLFGPDGGGALAMVLATQPPASHLADSLEANQNELAPLLRPDLFRGAWLTNPSVHYDRSNEQARRHYQHLLDLAQLGCPPDKQHTPLVAAADHQASGAKIILEGAKKSLATNNNGVWQNLPLGPSDNPNQMDTPLACLRTVSAETITRHYLAKDDSSDPLEDQNGLPVPGPFPERFVTVDGQLVRSWFPFDGTTTCPRQLGTEPNKPMPTKSTKPHPWPQELAKDFLIGSTAQAVAFWPNPKDSDTWDWFKFEKYVNDSLKSFTNNLPAEALSLYRSNSNQKQQTDNNNGHAAHAIDNPNKVYQTMVSDIRQTCPANKLAVSLTSYNHRVRRYIVELGPSSESVPKTSPTTTATSTTTKTPLTSSVSSATKSSPPVALLRERPNKVPPRSHLAFHTWDLQAFFGFNTDQHLRPSAKDLQFQTHIRDMVRRFVHLKPSNDPVSEPNRTQMANDTLRIITSVFLEDGGIRNQSTAYVADKCTFWYKHLMDCYAWVS